MIKTELCRLCTKNNTDKGPTYHHYSRFYHELFRPIRDKPISIFELGLGTTDPSIPSNMGKEGRPGASLYTWKQYFPNADIYGADIDKTILFQEERIQTFYCNQLDTVSIHELWVQGNMLNKQFDILIDDGLHTYKAATTFFERSFHKIAKNGVYIVEDIEGKSVSLYKQYMLRWQSIHTEFDFWFVNIETSDSNSIHDNWLMICQRNR